MNISSPIFFIAFALFASRTAVAANGVDLTQAYQYLYKADCVPSQKHLLALRKHKVLLVPGYLSNFDPAYFAEQMRWFKTVDIAHEKVDVKTGQSIAVNASIIATAIRESAKPVVLFTHSKGSVDALEALRTDSALQSKVKGWVSLQGAFFGSPIADMLIDDSLLNPFFSTLILGFVGGTKEAAQGLTTTASSKYYQNHKAEIGAIIRNIPIVAFASALDSASGDTPKTRLELPHELMQRAGIRNDGLVPIDAAVIPGMDFIRISGIDHIAPVMPAIMRFDRVRMTKALLLLLTTHSGRTQREVTCD